MADPMHLRLLKQGKTVWNTWRKSHPEAIIDLSGEDLSCLRLTRGVDLSKANLEGSKLIGATLNQAIFDEANLNGVSLLSAELSHARFEGATLDRANLSQAFLKEAVFACASLREAKLAEAYLSGAQFVAADLCRADLTAADLSLAHLRETKLNEAQLRGCWVYGMSVDPAQLQRAMQANLIITQPWESSLYVDDFGTAQLVWSWLGKGHPFDGSETRVKQVVLILGHFFPERERILNTFRDHLRLHHYAPVVFDWSRPPSERSLEILSTLAQKVQFMLADITDAHGLLQDLQLMMPHLQAVPIQLLWQGSLSQQQQDECHGLCRYPWVLAAQYQETEGPLDMFSEQIIDALEQKAEESARMR